MIWRVVARYAELSGCSTATAPAATYALLDGLFQQALLDLVTGDEQVTLAALADLPATVRALMPLLLGNPLPA